MEDLFGGIPQGAAQPNVVKKQNAEMVTVDVVIWTWQLCKDGLCNFATLNLWLVGKHVKQFEKLTKLPCGHIDLEKGPSETNQEILFPT